MHNTIVSANASFLVALRLTMHLDMSAIAADWLLIEVIRKVCQQYSEALEENDRLKSKHCIGLMMTLFLLGGISCQLVFDMIKRLVDRSFEDEVDTLNFVLHNIGLRLRSANPSAIKEFLDEIEVKAKSFTNSVKFSDESDPELEEKKRQARKI